MKSNHVSLGGARVAVLAMSVTLAGCEWFTDFKRQPSVWTWESMRTDSLVVRGNPVGSIPRGGMTVPVWKVSYSSAIPVIDSFSTVPNPTPISDASLANGRQFYQMNCAVCHGDKGMGDGKATRYGMAGISLVFDVTKNRTDGYMYGMIRNGRNLMPSYNRIEEQDRWDVVNYIRALQGKAPPEMKFEIGPVAPPGITGAALPGLSATAPTRPAPHYRGAAAAEAPKPNAAAPEVKR